MSVSKEYPAGGGAANFPRPEKTPRRYAVRADAERIAAHYRRMAYFTRRGEAYPYACATCAAYHVGIDTGAKWHECRVRHDNYADFSLIAAGESAA